MGPPEQRAAARVEEGKVARKSGGAVSCALCGGREPPWCSLAEERVKEAWHIDTTARHSALSSNGLGNVFQVITCTLAAVS